MDEYIKRTDAYNAILDELVGTGYQSGALRAIEFIPTADVAPRAELAREIFGEIEKHGRKMQSSDFSGDFWDIAVLMSDIAELKKKYTEANHETRN